MDLPMNEKLSYEINGRVYTFVNLRWEYGHLYGTCTSKSKSGRKALLCDNYIQFNGEPIVPAKKIS